MRALRIDPKHGNSQRCAEMRFNLCTYSFLLQDILLILLPLSSCSCYAGKGLCEGDVSFQGLNRTALHRLGRPRDRFPRGCSPEVVREMRAAPRPRRRR